MFCPNHGQRPVSTTAALRVAIDIETPIVFLYSFHYRSLSLTIAAQRSRSGNAPLDLNPRTTGITLFRTKASPH